MANSKQLEHPLDKEWSMSQNLLNKSKLLSVMQECLPQNNETILNDRLITCKKSSQKVKSSKISAAASTLREKDFLSLLIKSLNAKSKQLWLPTKIDCADSPSIFLNNYSKNTEHKSWFSIKLIARQNKNSQKTLQQLYTCSPVDFTDSGNTVKRSKKIRIYPTTIQKRTLKIWAGIARRSYNATIEHLRKPDTKANRFDIQKQILDSLGDCHQTPYKIKQMAIEDACQAVQLAKKKFLKTKQFQQVGFRAKKQRQDSLYIPHAAADQDVIFKRILGKVKFSEKIKGVKHDSRLVIEKNRFFLVVPESKPVLTPENQRKKSVSLDPGARTFLTAFDNEHAFKIGQGDFSRIYRLLLGLDSLFSKAKTCKKKYRRAIDNSLFKIDNLINELHKQTASFLVQRYDEIIIPNFSATQMVSKLRSKTCRNLLSFAHSKFRNFLKLKCEEFSTKLTIVSEEFTSKTCGNCGHVQNIGGKSHWKCKECYSEMDRDVNGARNIMFLAL